MTTDKLVELWCDHIRHPAYSHYCFLSPQDYIGGEDTKKTKGQVHLKQHIQPWTDTRPEHLWMMMDSGSWLSDGTLLVNISPNFIDLRVIRKEKVVYLA